MELLPAYDPDRSPEPTSLEPPWTLVGMGQLEDSQAAQKIVRMLLDMYNEALRCPVTFGMEYPTNVAELCSVINRVTKSGRPHALELALGQEDGPNALHYAAGCGCMEVCEKLLKDCARLNYQGDLKFRTPLMWSVKRGLVATSELLLRYGADANHVDAKGFNCLYLAVARGYEKLAGVLLTIPGVQQNVNHRGPGGRTILHAAADVGSPSLCNRLVGLRADVLAVTTSLQNPLHLAVKQGNAAVVQYLMKVESERGFLMEDAAGKRPIDYAEEREMHDIINILQRPDLKHQKLLRKWQAAFSVPDRLLLHPETPGGLAGLPRIGPPSVVRVRETELRLVAHVRDVECRIVDYVIEVKLLRTGARTPGKLYYSRTEQQRQIDDVDFDVPRFRENGLPVWEHGLTYQFRVTGHGQLDPRPENDLRSITSEWSEATQLRRASRARSASTTRSGSGYG